MHSNPKFHYRLDLPREEDAPAPHEHVNCVLAAQRLLLAAGIDLAIFRSDGSMSAFLQEFAPYAKPFLGWGGECGKAIRIVHFNF